MTMAEDRQITANVPYAVTTPDRIPARRYYDREFYDLECENLWPRVWQMACRLEEIPNVGDFVEYKNIDQSVIVVRTAPDTVKAYNNACRHRGVTLVEDRGNCSGGFVCPFHGWCWGLDGASTWVYQPDLFSEANRDENDLRLKECRLETWGGCAFINLDDNAPPLRSTMGDFATIMDAWEPDTLRVEWWYAARLPTNWKLAMEAFMEGYHVLETHPQLLPKGFNNKVYKALDDTAIGSATSRLRDAATGQTVDSKTFIDMQLYFMRRLSEGMAGMTHEKEIRVAEGLRSIELPGDPALASVEWRRRLNEAVMAWYRNAGCSVPDLLEIDRLGLASSVNFCFPHFFLLPTYGSASSYRIRPLGPEETLFELWSLTRYPPGSEPEPPKTPTPMAHDDPRWPPIPMQDFSNLPRQQRGLHTKGFDFMRLSHHVEGRVSNYQRTIDRYLAGLDHEQIAPALKHASGSIDVKIAAF